MTALFSALVVFLLGLVAIEKWRREEIGKRRLDLALRISAGCEELRQAFIFARSDAASTVDASSRPVDEHETVDQKRLRDGFFSKATAIVSADDVVEHLRKDSFAARLLFGEEVFEELGKIFTFRRQMLDASDELIRRTTREGLNIDYPLNAKMLRYLGHVTRGQDGKPDRGEDHEKEFETSVHRIQEILASEISLEASRTLKIVGDMVWEMLSPVRWIGRQVLRFWRWYGT